MAKVLIEIEQGTVTHVETSTDELEVYVFDHDIVREGRAGDLKRYLRDANAPVEIDMVAEEDLETKLQALVGEGRAKLEDMTGVREDEEKGVFDLVTLMKRR